MKSMNRLFTISGNPDKTIGVVIPFFWDGNSKKLVKGICDAAKNFKINLLIFQGMYCSQRTYFSNDEITYEEAGNVIFELVSDETIDGLIINTGGFKKHADKLKLLELCSLFDPLPMVSVGSEIEGIPNVLLENEQSIRFVMEHLINTHNKKRIAFIRGPADHKDSNKRMNAYTEVLKENKIEFNSYLISPPGVWNGDLAGIAAYDILRKTSNTVDAFVCISDAHAHGVIKKLKANGIRVPLDIAVIGFNDEPIAMAAFPPITTVDRSLYERGWKAVELICKHFSGDLLSGNVLVPGQFIVRQSCGCMFPGLAMLESSVIDSVSDGSKSLKKTDALSIELKAALVNELGINGNDQERLWYEELVDFLIIENKYGSRNNFLSKFDSVLHKYSKRAVDLDLWYSILNTFYRIVNRAEYIPNRYIQLSFINQARIYLGEIAELYQKKILMLFEDRNITINSLSHSFNTINNFEAIIDLLATELPKIGISACYLSLYEDPQVPTGLCRLFLAYDKNGRIPISSDGIQFKSIQLIPGDFINQDELKTLILEPLYYGPNQLGFTLFKFTKGNNSFYELFPAQLSAAIWSSLLYKRVLQKDQELKVQTRRLIDSNETLRENALKIERAYQQIQQNQDKLLYSEKMASLGKLTAGIVHEMNTPIATVRASLAEMDTLVKEYDSSIGDKEIVSSDHTQIADDISNAIDLAEKAVTRAILFIKSIKAQTRDIKVEEKQIFNVIEIVDSVLIFLGHSLRHSKCRVNFQYENNRITLLGSPTRMTQVFTNLITNAIDAMENSDNKVIGIELNASGQKLQVKVADNGCGIPPENSDKIFDSMFTTKPFGRGTGLGLAIIKDIITNDFGGSINVESKVGVGATFVIEMPINREI